MTKDVNQVTIVGNLVSDPEIHQHSDVEYAFLRVATGKMQSNKDVEEDPIRKNTTYHDVHVHVAHIVELVKTLKKGDRVVLSGEIKNTQTGNSIALLAPQARFYKVV